MTKRVCVAIADEVQRAVVQFALSSMDFEVCGEAGTTSPAECGAGESNAGARFDLFITDTEQAAPGEPGWHAGNASCWAETPILLVTREGGAHGYAEAGAPNRRVAIPMPINPYLLLERVRSLTGTPEGLPRQPERFDLALLEVFYNRGQAEKP